MSAPIKRTDVIHFRYVLDVPLPSTLGPFRCRPALLLRVEDDDGAEGWGEIWCNFPPDGDFHRARLAANVMGHALAGMTSDVAQSPFLKIKRRLKILSLQAGEPGPVAQIAAGLDIALHDLAARRAGKPLAAFLGGTRSAVAAYASGVAPGTYASQYEKMRALGYSYFKHRVGFGRDNSLPEAEEAFSGLHSDERMMFDGNQSWTVEQAARLVGRIAKMNPLFLEEPLPANSSLAEWQTLSRATDIPLAAGENLRSHGEFDAAIDGNALTILQPDACKWGGISETLKLVRKAQAAGLVYFPHYLGGGVGLMASAHLLAAAGGDGMLEVDSSENPLSGLLTPNGVRLQDGLLPIPPGSGLGYRPDLQAASDMLQSKISIDVPEG